jgi:hypothetical protein
VDRPLLGHAPTIPDPGVALLCRDPRSTGDPCT